MSPLVPDQNKHTDNPAHSGTDASFQARLLDAVSEAVIALDMDQKVIYWNRAAEGMYGWSAEEVMGRNLREMVVPEDSRKRAEEILRKVRETGHWSGEFVVRHKDGASFPVAASNRPLRDETGNLVGVISVLRDVTESKKAEERFRESEERYRTLVEQVPAVIYINPSDGSHLTLYISPQIEAMLGYTPKEWTATDLWAESIHPDDALRVLAANDRSRESGEPLAEEYRLIAKDGSVVWVRDESALLRDEAGEPLFWQGVMVNITESKRTEEALRESEERYRSLVELSPDAILVHSEGKLVYINTAGAKLLGSPSPDQLIGEPALDLIHPDYQEAARERARLVLTQAKQVEPIEEKIVCLDGRVIDAEVAGSFIFYKGKPAVQNVIRDITERKESEKEKARQTRYAALRADVNSALTQGGTLPSILQQCTECIFRRLDAAFARIWTLDEEEDVLELQASAGMYIHLDGPHSRVPLGEYKIGLIAQEQRPYLTNEVLGDPRISEKEWAKQEGMVAFAGYPLVVEGHLVGVMAMFSREPLKEDIIEGLGSVADAIAQGIKRKEAEEALRSSEIELRSLFGAMTDVILILDSEGRYLKIAPTNPSLTYKPPEDLVGKTLHEVFPQEQAETFLGYIRRALETQQTVYMDYSLPIGGEEVWFSGSISSMMEDQVFFVARDITDRKQAEELMKRQADMLEQTHDAVFMWKLGGEIIYWNKGAERLYGWSKKEALGRISHELLKTIHPFGPEELDSRLQRDGHWEGELVHHTRDGRQVVVESRHVLTSSDTGPGFVLETNHDVTERKRAEERLQHQAFYDLLTDLPNRQLFTDRLKQALKRTRRRSGRKKKVGVLFMDLDNFKVINDSLGHEIGDRLLVAVGERIRGSLRPEDTLARFGGDEFTVLVENIEDPADTVGLAQRIIESHREPFALEGRELFVKPSIGISFGEANTTSSPAELLRDADMAMYRAKKGGLGCQVFEPAMYEQALRRLKMENDLQRAIESEEFVVHYQPIINLQTGETWGMEALVRWQHPERGLLDPKEFVLVAEENGLVLPMGEQVLREACKQAKEWQESHPNVSPWVISVNLSARQVVRPDLSRTVERVLQETGFEAASLSLDITETVYIEALEGNTTALDELKGLGIRLSIDDFGTGYSSLAYLKRLPADTLKIDKSFIRALGEDIEDTALVKMTIDLAHTFGMEVVAEGVESEYQAEQLKEMSCDLGQGYHLTKPLPPEAVEEFLA